MFNFDWLSNIDLRTAKILMLLAFFSPLIFSLFLKKEYIYKGATDKKIWRNLRLWIMALTFIMATVYIYF